MSSAIMLEPRVPVRSLSLSLIAATSAAPATEPRTWKTRFANAWWVPMSPMPKHVATASPKVTAKLHWSPHRPRALASTKMHSPNVSATCCTHPLVPATPVAVPQQRATNRNIPRNSAAHPARLIDLAMAVFECIATWERTARRAPPSGPIQKTHMSPQIWALTSSVTLPSRYVETSAGPMERVGLMEHPSIGMRKEWAM
mmetsp:Transcript_41078/g.110317  ORF Transcript_41078/g.110317 Transcript_41078/m.110317 type:complete len:200 (+) Transcript_41078:1-600(+)